MALYGAGAALGAISLGGLLATVGAQVLPKSYGQFSLLLIALASTALGLLDLRRNSRWAPGLNRQTVSQWRVLLGRKWAAFLWGFDLGLGFTTIRVTSLYWLLVLIVLVRRSLSLGFFLFASYALAQTVGVMWAQHRAARSGTACFRVLSLPRQVRVMSAKLLLVWSLSMTLAMIQTGPFP